MKKFFVIGLSAVLISSCGDLVPIDSSTNGSFAVREITLSPAEKSAEVYVYKIKGYATMPWDTAIKFLTSNYTVVSIKGCKASIAYR